MHGIECLVRDDNSSRPGMSARGSMAHYEVRMGEVKGEGIDERG